MTTYTQTISFNNTISILLRWPDFKTIIQSKHLSVQYVQDAVLYTIFSIDGPITYSTALVYNDSGFPFTSLWPDYSQAQNDIDVVDFQNNFLPYANKPFLPASSISLGYATSSGSALTVMRATAYNQQTVAAQRSMSSSSASDAAAGTGANSITVTYYDGYMNGPFTEIVTLNGTTPVNTVNTNICYIEKMCCNSVGNQLSNVGTITLFVSTGGGGGTIGTIPAGDGITNWCHHYVGLNKTMSIASLIGSIQGPANGSIEIHRTVPTDVTKTELTIAPKLRIMSNTSTTMNLVPPIVVQGPALVLMYGRSDSSSGTLNWSVSMGYFEV